MFDVEYYEKEDGTFPAEEFILSLDSKMQAKMFVSLICLKPSEISFVNLTPNRLETEYMRFVQRWLPTLQEFCISSWSIRR